MTVSEEAWFLRDATGASAVSLKLDSWANSTVLRDRDKTDVIELILRRQLPRELTVHSAMRSLYEETWDSIQAAKK